MTDKITAEEKEQVAKSSQLRNIGILFSALAVIILLAAFSYAYYQLLHINASLSGALSELQTKITSDEQQLSAQQNTLGTLQQFAQKSQSLAEQQGKQQEQMLTEWQALQKGDLNKWNIAEAKYLVKLANDYLQLAHDNKLALVLLTRANQILENLPDPNLLEIKKSLSADITQLQATSDVNITDLYLQLTGLDNQVDSLLITPVTSSGSEVKNEETSAPSQTSWWKAGMQNSLRALSKIVIVRHNNSQAPLLLPEEKAFLYQNLHAKMQNAMWGVLNRNNAVYQESLLQVERWIKQYFAQDVNETKAVLEKLAALRKINIEPPTINFANTLQLFNQVV